MRRPDARNDRSVAMRRQGVDQSADDPDLHQRDQPTDHAGDEQENGERRPRCDQGREREPRELPGIPPPPPPGGRRKGGRPTPTPSPPPPGSGDPPPPPPPVGQPPPPRFLSRGVN